ncbi:MAG: shikimate dehydrogenase [Helicobacteraceae bacterium]|jgi:shikimate dehydrogenase|nr:shikimate dehydrogenase [Helicobacteraceae bacterium]
MKLLAVMGDPIAHSLSPLMHNFVYRQNAIDAVYTRLRVENGDNLREIFKAHNLSGANITLPHKEAAFAQADEISSRAKKIGAVNTWAKQSDRLIGHNTDADGFAAAIAPLDAFKNALMIGAGGAARAIAIALIEAGVELAVVNRSEARLEFFAQNGAKVFVAKNPPNQRFDLVINATSAGLKDDETPLDKSALEDYLSSAKMAYDAIYGVETPFLRLAKLRGAETKDGEDMLAFQGAIAHSLFFGGDVAAIAAQMKSALRLPKSWR